MKIGFDVSDLCTNRADGTTRYTLELAKRFPSAGLEHEWHYFGPCQNIEYRIWNTESKNSKFQIPNSNVHFLASPWPKYWTQLRLPVDLFRYQPDVLFMPIQQIPYVRPRKLKTVAVVHDLAFHIYPEQFTYKDWVLQHTFTAYAVRKADQIVAVSKSTAEDIEKLYGRTHNVHVIHHGLDHKMFRTPTEPERARSWKLLQEKYPGLRKPYLLYVGQIQPRKNLVRLVRAFEKLLTDGEDLQLVIAGGHGWLQSSIFRNIEQSPAREHILRLGRVSDTLLPALYWHAEAFVLPSLYEGFGMPILEAMASGCPVVTSNVSSMPEVAGGAAIIVDPESQKSLVHGIQQARWQAAILREKGIMRARSFSWDTTVARLASILMSFGSKT